MYRCLVAQTSERNYRLFGEGDGPRALEVLVETTRATLVTFHVDSDYGRLELTNIDTDPGFRRQGHARAAVVHLVEAFPELHVIASPAGINSDEGEALIERLRADGVPLHLFGCFRDGLDCRCGL